MIVYMWGYFRLMSEALDSGLAVVEKAINDTLARGEKSELRADDLGICNIIKGCMLKQYGDHFGAEECFLSVLKLEKEIKLDHYLLQYSMMELGQLFIETNRKEEAKDYLETARSKYKNFSMENRLHFRVHLLLGQLENMA